MTLAFVQKISVNGTGQVSFALPSGGSTALTLLVAEVEQAAGTSFTPPGGQGWIAGPSAASGANVIAEQWFLPYNPGGLATAGTPLVFTGAGGAIARGTLSEWSSAAGTSQQLLASGVNTAASGTGLTVSSAPPATTGAIAVGNWAASFSAAQAGTWTGPGGSWVADQFLTNATLIPANYHLTGVTGGTGGFATMIGAAGNDPSIGCPTSIAGWTYANGVLGPLDCVKLFYNGALPTSIGSRSGLQGGGSPNDLPAGIVPVICYKTPDTNLTSYVTSVTRPVILVWLQEAEGQTYTYSQFQTIFQRQSTTIRAVGNTNVRVAMCSLGYAYSSVANNADAVAGRWIVPAAYVDMYLWDGYQHYDTKNGVQPAGYRWPSAGLSNWDEWINWAAVAAPKGKPLGIAEYGIDAQMIDPPSSDPTCAARTARLTADRTYLTGAFGPGGTVSTLPMALWIYWYSDCTSGVITTDTAHAYQFPSTETASVTAWQANRATALSATASYSTGTAVTGWAAAISVYAEIPAPVPQAPVITTTSLPAATTGVAYSQTLAETGGAAPLTWTIVFGSSANSGAPPTGGALPDGLTLDPVAGIISGTPAADAATSGFTVAVTDANGLTGTQALFITVVTGIVPTPAPAPPGPGFPQILIEAGLLAAAPQVPAGTFILDDPVYGRLSEGNMLADSTTWTDIAAYFRNGSISRPSTRVQGPLITYQSGTASGTFDNTTGVLDPDNPAGPFYGALRPMVPFRIRAVYGSVAYNMWSGFAGSFTGADLGYDMGYDETTITADDGFKVLAGSIIPASPPDGLAGDGEDTGARVTRILNAAGWYTDHRRVTTGDTLVQGTLFGDTALNLLQLTCDNEVGELYMDGAGNVVFRHRHAILTETRSTTPQAVFGDLPGTVHAAGTELACIPHRRADDDTTLCNDVQATTQGGTLQEAENFTSQRTYLFPRSYSRTDLILEDNPTTLQWAQWVLAVSAAGEDHFDAITIDTLADPVNLFPQVLAREIGDRIQVWRRPQNSAAIITQDCFIRGIQHDVDAVAGTWSTTWTLQSAARYTGFLILDDPVQGLLNTAKLAF